MIKKNFFAEKALAEEGCHGGRGVIQFRRMLEAELQSKISFLDYTVVPPGSSIGYHAHLDTEEIYIVLEGTGLMTVDGEDQQVVRGDVVFNRRGGSHGLANNGTTDLEIMVVEGRF
jgi:mannose-6-phosphate isomerase-like protein (cupin superfamily)